MTEHQPGSTKPPGAEAHLPLGGKRVVAFLAGLAATFLGLALIGPRAQMDREPVPPVALPEDLEAYLLAGERSVPRLREGDAKAIRWVDSLSRAPTELAVVYIHGFSADRHEVAPVPERVAGSLGANLFLTRLAGHGADGAAMGEATAADWLRDTEEALAVGARLGRKVVVVGTSTGGTLAVWAAAQDRWRETLAAVVVLSPNFGPRDRTAEILLWPWGGLLARLIVGPERCFEPLNAAQERHWTTCYPTAALLPMMALVEHVRSSDLGRVRAPVLVLYSPADAVVDTGATERLFPFFGSPRKELVVMEGSDDPAHHVLAGDILSPTSTDWTVAEILRFVRSIQPDTIP
ncbi:MAG: alpha/beta fold hydrolase [Longimicrobiales bacterium]|nr:alpha/beta fold hydrolase [Longimicrobiales bacterium]